MTRAQVLGQEVQVALRCRDLRVSEDHREPDDVAALTQIIRRECVTEAMPAERLQR